MKNLIVVLALLSTGIANAQWVNVKLETMYGVKHVIRMDCKGESILLGDKTDDLLFRLYKEDDRIEITMFEKGYNEGQLSKVGTYYEHTKTFLMVDDFTGNIIYLDNIRFTRDATLYILDDNFKKLNEILGKKGTYEISFVRKSYEGLISYRTSIKI